MHVPSAKSVQSVYVCACNKGMCMYQPKIRSSTIVCGEPMHVQVIITHRCPIPSQFQRLLFSYSPGKDLSFYLYCRQTTHLKELFFGNFKSLVCQHEMTIISTTQPSDITFFIFVIWCKSQRKNKMFVYVDSFDGQLF